MNAWLRSNRWYLVALVVLVPVAILVAMSTDYFRYEQSLRGEPIPVSATASVDYAGGTWTLLERHSFTADTDAGRAANLIDGTELVTATFAVVPPAEGFFCQTELWAADGRHWGEASFSDADFEIDSDAEGYCLSDQLDPYRLQVFYVIPEGASEGASIHLDVSSELPRFLQFAL